VNPSVIVIIIECRKLSLEVNIVPEQNVIEEHWFDTRASRNAWNWLTVQ
jgi:hypothetical protein